MRVHLSAYPGERYLYFDRVRAFLAKQDGLLVSDTPCPQDGKDDLPRDAQVLVILASEKYFTAKNTGFLSEYQKAKERGIAVIPLLFDDRIVNLLNTRCGKIQYIAVGDDLTAALSLLAKRLAMEGKPAEKAPKIFISYRKKDKAELEQLLHVISSCACAEHLPVWYDGDISPGENYAKEIKDALTDSALVILLVTPSLLEKGNFVLREEYPSAKRMGKRILAVEAVKTDKKALAAHFDGLPRLIGIKQIGAIEAELLRLMRG